MKPKEITVHGIPILIRLMDTGYLMADREPTGVAVTVGCRIHAKPEQWPNPMYVKYYRKLTEAYDACAILAWQKHTLVGFIPFVPTECGINLPACLHYVDQEEMPEVEAFAPLPKEDMRQRVLKTHCLSVTEAMRRMGVGSAMVRYLVEWARVNGWARIEGWAFENGDFGWVPSIEFWEKCGFKRGKARCWDEYITDPGFEYYIDL